MHYPSTLIFTTLTLTALATAFPIPAILPSLLPRVNLTDPLGLNLDTNKDLKDISNFSPIEDGFLEGDSDSGDGNDNGSTGVSVANWPLGGGSGSAANTNSTSGSTSSFCSMCPVFDFCLRPC